MVRIMNGIRMAALLFAGGMMAAAFAPTAVAQQQPGKSKQEMSQQKEYGQQQMKQQTRTQTLLRGESLVGMNVRNDQREDLGTVEEIAVDEQMQEASYAAVSTDKGLVAVPITALEKRHGNDYLVLDVRKEQLSQAPTFEKDNYPAKYDRQFWQQTGVPCPGMQQQGAQQQGMQPEQQAQRQQGMQAEQQAQQQQGMKAEQQAQRQEGQKIHKLSEVIGQFQVESQDNQKIGKLSDVLIETNDGRLVYGVVAFDTKELRDQMAIVPFDSIEFRPDQQTAQVNADINKLRSVAFFPSNYPSLDQRYLSRISQTFDTQPYWEVFGYPPPQPQLPPQQEQMEKKSQQHQQQGVKPEHQKQQKQQKQQY